MKLIETRALPTFRASPPFFKNTNNPWLITSRAARGNVHVQGTTRSGEALHIRKRFKRFCAASVAGRYWNRLLSPCCVLTMNSFRLGYRFSPLANFIPNGTNDPFWKRDPVRKNLLTDTDQKTRMCNASTNPRSFAKKLAVGGENTEKMPVTSIMPLL